MLRGETTCFLVVIRTQRGIDVSCGQWFDTFTPQTVEWEGHMSYDEALELVSRDDRFKATVYAMNTLLIHKGVYTREEFEGLFVEWVSKEIRKPVSERTSVDAVRSYSA